MRLPVQVMAIHAYSMRCRSWAVGCGMSVSHACGHAGGMYVSSIDGVRWMRIAVLGDAGVDGGGVGLLSRSAPPALDGEGGGAGRACCSECVRRT